MASMTAFIRNAMVRKHSGWHRPCSCFPIPWLGFQTQNRPTSLATLPPIVQHVRCACAVQLARPATRSSHPRTSKRCRLHASGETGGRREAELRSWHTAPLDLQPRTS